MHIRARVNARPHPVITLDQNTDLSSSRPEEERFCTALERLGQFFQIQKHEDCHSSGFLSVRTAPCGRSCTTVDISVAMSDHSELEWILPGLQ